MTADSRSTNFGQGRVSTSKHPEIFARISGQPNDNLLVSALKKRLIRHAENPWPAYKHAETLLSYCLDCMSFHESRLVKSTVHLQQIYEQFICQNFQIVK